MVEMIWDGKYDGRITPPRLKLPFQTGEFVNASAQKAAEFGTS
jgi:hypothetical protein